MSLISFLFDGVIKPASLSGLSLISLVAAILYVLYIFSSAIYNVYFHPSRRIPGPKTWIAFPLFYHLAAIRGVLDQKLKGFHERYGEVVRFSPEMASFITAQAWKDIYGYGHKQLPKRVFSVMDQHQTSSFQTMQTIHASEKHCLTLFLKRPSEIKNH